MNEARAKRVKSFGLTVKRRAVDAVADEVTAKPYRRVPEAPPQGDDVAVTP